MSCQAILYKREWREYNLKAVFSACLWTYYLIQKKEKKAAPSSISIYICISYKANP
jgi:hypothetical protein